MKNNFNFIFVCMLPFLCLLNGCATVKETYSSDGRKAFALNCSGNARGWDKCYAAAGEICNVTGYDILERSSENASTSNMELNSIAASSYSMSTKERSMLIACKK